MRKLVLTNLLVALVVTLAPPAHAHSERTSSQPDEGDRLGRAPAMLAIDFSEPPTSGAKVTVLDGCGRNVVSAIDVRGQTIETALAEGQPGAWTVQTSVISSVDGHNTTDEWRFRVRGAADCAAAAPEPDAPIETPAGGSIPVVPLVIAAVAVVGIALVVRSRGA